MSHVTKNGWTVRRGYDTPNWPLWTDVARERPETYDAAVVVAAVRSDVPVHRLGLLALLDDLPGIRAVEDAGPDVDGTDQPADLLVVADQDTLAEQDPVTDTTPLPALRVVHGHPPERTVLKTLSGPVRGVIRMDAPRSSWTCAILGLARGGFFVDPALTAGLVLLAAVGTPYGPRPLGLTPQQQLILSAVGRGLSNRAIARDLAISPDTVKSHLSAAMRTLDVWDRHEAARLWITATRGEG